MWDRLWAVFIRSAEEYGKGWQASGNIDAVGFPSEYVYEFSETA
jgi:hypothetical protein